jgi:uncharacterized protein YicC (UPF0701 family)
MKSSDVWFCAFLISKGHKIKAYSVIGRGKVNCEFKLSQDEWRQLKLEYNNSEISNYKMIIEKIKDLAY